jgi:cellulase
MHPRSLEWHQHAQRTGEDAISSGHKGPVLVYIAKAPTTAAAFNGQGAVWTKIYQSGLLAPSSQTWASDVVNANAGASLYTTSISTHLKALTSYVAPAGKHSVVLPASLPAGEYLIRAEVVRLPSIFPRLFILADFDDA